MSNIVDGRAPALQVGERISIRPLWEKVVITRPDAPGGPVIHEHATSVAPRMMTIDFLSAHVAMMNFILQAQGLELTYTGALDVVGSTNHPSTRNLMTRKQECIGPDQFFRELHFIVRARQP